MIRLLTCLVRRNLPLTAIVFVVAGFCVRLPTPPGTFREKAKQLNILGNLVFIASITLFTTGLTYGGNTYPWGDVKVRLSAYAGFSELT